jgi:hypothetical protein
MFQFDASSSEETNHTKFIQSCMNILCVLWNSTNFLGRHTSVKWEFKCDLSKYLEVKTTSVTPVKSPYSATFCI